MEFSWNIFQVRQCDYVSHVESLWRPPSGPAVVLSKAVGPMRGNFLVSKFSVSSWLISSSAAAVPRVNKSSTKHTYRLEAKRQKTPTLAGPACVIHVLQCPPSEVTGGSGGRMMLTQREAAVEICNFDVVTSDHTSMLAVGGRSSLGLDQSDPPCLDRRWRVTLTRLCDLTCHAAIMLLIVPSPPFSSSTHYAYTISRPCSLAFLSGMDSTNSLSDVFTTSRDLHSWTFCVSSNLCSCDDNGNGNGNSRRSQVMMRQAQH